MLIVRKATIQDIGSITEIYNHAIATTTATFDTTPKTLDEQKSWFESHDARHPVIVVEQDGEIIGWGALSQYSDRCAYADTAEASLYVREGYRGMGVGRALSAALAEKGRTAGLHTVILRITQGNTASIALAESLGFNHVGILKEVGKKFGKLLDVYIMQKIL